MTLQEKLKQIEAKKRYTSKIIKVKNIIVAVTFTILFLTFIGLISKIGNITINDVEKTLIICILITIGIYLISQLNKIIKEEIYDIRDIENKLKIVKKYHLKDDKFVEIISVTESELRFYAMLILEKEKISVKVVGKIGYQIEFEDIIDNFCCFQAIYNPKN